MIFASNLETLPENVRVAIEGVISTMNAWIEVEHNDAGHHTNITALGLELATTPALPGDQELTLAPGDEWNTTVVGTVNLQRQGKHVVRVTAASGTPEVTAIADNSATTADAATMFVAINASGSTIAIKHDAGGYFAHQRIYCAGSVTYPWTNNQQLIFRYDAISQRWRFDGDVLTLGGLDDFSTTISGTASLPRSGKQVVRITSATSTPQITAIADSASTQGQPGEVFFAINTSGNTIGILHDTGGAASHQRIYCAGRMTYPWVDQQQLIFRYDAISQRWRFDGDNLTLGGPDDFSTTVSGTVNLPRGGKKVVRVTSAASTPAVTAIADDASTVGQPGEVFVAINTSGTTISILNNAGGFSADQRIITPGQVTYSWVGQQMLFFRFDIITQRWRFTGELQTVIDETRLIPTGGIAAMLFKTSCPSGWSTHTSYGRFIRIASTYGTQGGSNSTGSIPVNGTISVSASGTYDNHQHHYSGNTDDPVVNIDDHIKSFHDVEDNNGNPFEVVSDVSTDHTVSVDYDTGFSGDTDVDGGGAISVTPSVDDIDLAADSVSTVPEYEEWIVCVKN